MRPSRLTALAVASAALGVAPAAVGAQTSAAEPGEVIVRFDSDRTAVQERVAERNDTQLSRQLPLDGVATVQVEPGQSAAQVADRLSEDPAVRWAEPDRPVHIALTPNDPLLGSQWSLSTIRAPQAWDTTTGSPAVRVAVVDTAVDGGHPDLAPNVPSVINAGESGGGRESNGVDDDGNGFVDDVRGWDFYDQDNNPGPVAGDHWHGTHVSSVIAARGNDGTGISGVVWQAQIMRLRVLGPTGSGWFSDVVAAFAYAGQNGARIVNASLGGPGGQDLSNVMKATFEAAPNTLFVVAAGNEGSNNDGSSPSLPCAVPAENVICVAATDQSDGMASFSNYGRTSVDLGAPGVGVLGAVLGGGHGSYSGTSFASPNTAGVAALVLARNPTFSTAQLKATVLDGAAPTASLAGVTVTGGRLDAPGALAIVPQPAATPPPGFQPPPATPPDPPAAAPPPGQGAGGAGEPSKGPGAARARVVRVGRGWELRLTLEAVTEVGALVRRRVLRQRRAGAASKGFRFRTVRGVRRRSLAAGRHVIALGRLRPGVHRVELRLSSATGRKRLVRTVRVAAPLRPIMQVRRRGAVLVVRVDVPSRGSLEAAVERRARRRGTARWVTVRSAAGKRRRAGLSTLRLRAPRAGGHHRVRVVVWEDFRRTTLTEALR